LWSLCTALMGFTGGFVGLFILRLGCGLFEAGGYPVAAGVVRRWVPASDRGLASSIVAVGGRLGGAVAPVLTASLMVLSFPADGPLGGFGGWRIPFVLYGGAGLAVACLFVFLYRNHPRQHPAVNSAEVALIEGLSPDEAPRAVPTLQALPVAAAPPTESAFKAPSNVGDAPSAPATSLPEVAKRQPAPAVIRQPIGWPPLLEMLGDRSLWLNSLTQFGSNFSWVFLITLLPSYLAEVFHTSTTMSAWIQATTLYAGIVGMLLGGWLTDRVTARLGRRWGRSLPVVGARTVVGLAFLICLGLDDWLAVTIAMCVVAFATDLSNPCAWAYGQDVGGRHVGAVIGWANMWGNLGAAVSPIILTAARSAFADDSTAGWRAAFLTCVAVQAVAGLAAIGIDASKPLVPVEG
jgi:MFS family permease